MSSYLTIGTNGITTLIPASQTSAGVTDAGKIVALNSDGQIDTSMLNDFSQNVDGGFANSVYLTSQIIDGGGA